MIFYVRKKLKTITRQTNGPKYVWVYRKYHQMAAEDDRSIFSCEERLNLDVAVLEPELLLLEAIPGLECVCVIPL
jgi:hypothetical protein